MRRTMRSWIAYGIVAVLAAGIWTMSVSAGSGKLTKSSLTGGEWGPEFEAHGGLYISFNKNGTYDKEWRGEGRQECSGKYKLRGRKGLLLSRASDPGQSVETDFGCPRLVCELKTSRKSLFYSRSLDCGSQQFWDPKSAVPAGSARKIGRVRVRTLGGTKVGEVTWPMKYRKAPTKRGGRIKCRDTTRDDGKSISVIPKGRRLLFLARTANKQRIGKYRAYWYYVTPVDDETFSCDAERGWIYGAFVKWEK